MKKSASFSQSTPAKKAKTNSSEENETTSANISLDNETELNVEEDIENVERITLIEDKRKLRSHGIILKC